MKKLLKFLTFSLAMSLLIGSSLKSNAQIRNEEYVLFFKSGKFIPPSNLDFLIKMTDDQSKKDVLQGRCHVIIQFYFELNELAHEELKNSGINLLNAIGSYAYIASVPKNLDENTLNDFNIRAVVGIPIQSKLSRSISNNEIPEWARKKSGKVDVNLILQSDVNYSDIEPTLEKERIKVVNTKHLKYNQITIQIEESELENFAEYGFVNFIEPIEAPLKQLNHKGPQSTRTSYLTSVEGLTGKGVVIGIGDGGKIDHIDYNDRIVYQTAISDPFWGNHPFHIAGTIAGAGNVDPWFKGMAEEAKIITEYSYDIIFNIDSHYNNFGMTITNNSYGPRWFDCNNTGIYSTGSANIDQVALTFPWVLNIFAAGNSGEEYCNAYPKGYNTVYGSYASSKNCLTVGGIKHRGQEAGFSSKGPVMDGRIKPEVVTSGYYVVSCKSGNNYLPLNGTSAATSTASGAAAIITEAYMDVNNGQKPKADVLKAIIANSAQDGGIPGPDYSYGFGIIDAKRAVETIKEKRYFTGYISQSQVSYKLIHIPADAYQAKIMLYWHDKPGSLSMTNALVNNLDLEVLNYNYQIIKPSVLDPTPANVTNPATRGVDHLNNIEQVTLSGNELTKVVAIKITGSNVDMGLQRYVIAYDIIKPSVELTFPAGGENFAPGYKTDVIRWNSFGPDSDNVMLEYSLDDGTTWNAFNLSPENKALRYYNWSVPASFRSESARIRVSHVTQGYTDLNEIPFTIIPTPSQLIVTENCGNSVELSWNAAPDAKQYEILRLDTTMKVIGTTANTNYLVTGLMVGEEEWFTIRAVSQGDNPGSKMVAVNITPSSTPCLAKINLDESSSGKNLRSSINSILNNPSKFDVEVFPNPAAEFLNVKISTNENEEVRITISDLAGHIMNVESLYVTKTDVYTKVILLGDQYTEGMYIVLVQAGNQLETFKIFKTK